MSVRNASLRTVLIRTNDVILCPVWLTLEALSPAAFLPVRPVSSALCTTWLHICFCGYIPVFAEHIHLLTSTSKSTAWCSSLVLLFLPCMFASFHHRKRAGCCRVVGLVAGGVITWQNQQITTVIHS